MRIGNFDVPEWLAWLGIGAIIYELGRRLEGEREEPQLQSDVMTCAAWQTVETPSGQVIRCMFYETTCREESCLTEPAPYPPSIRELLERRRREPEEFDKDVKAVASMMASQENEKLDQGKEFYREILDRGGIRPYAKGVELEEYKDLPVYIRRKKGLPLDEMASEMG